MLTEEELALAFTKKLEMERLIKANKAIAVNSSTIDKPADKPFRAVRANFMAESISFSL